MAEDEEHHSQPEKAEMHLQPAPHERIDRQRDDGDDGQEIRVEIVGLQRREHDRQMLEHRQLGKLEDRRLELGACARQRMRTGQARGEENESCDRNETGGRCEGEAADEETPRDRLLHRWAPPADIEPDEQQQEEHQPEDVDDHQPGRHRRPRREASPAGQARQARVESRGEQGAA